MRDLLDRVAVPGRDAHDDGTFALDLALATEPAVALEAGRFLDAVLFGLGGFAEIVHALLDVDVAGGAGADGAAGVLDIDPVLDGDLEEVLAPGGLDFPLAPGGAGQTLGVLEDELNGHVGRAVGMIRMAKMHQNLSRTVGVANVERFQVSFMEILGRLAVVPSLSSPE